MRRLIRRGLIWISNVCKCMSEISMMSEVTWLYPNGKKTLTQSSWPILLLNAWTQCSEYTRIDKCWYCIEEWPRKKKGFLVNCFVNEYHQKFHNQNQAQNYWNGIQDSICMWRLIDFILMKYPDMCTDANKFVSSLFMLKRVSLHSNEPVTKKMLVWFELIHFNEKTHNQYRQQTHSKSGSLAPFWRYDVETSK